MHSSINGHLDSVYVLQFANRVFNNIHVRMHTYFHFSWITSGDGMTTLCGIGLCLLFEEIGDQFFRVINLFDIPFSRIWVPWSPGILVSLLILFFFWDKGPPCCPSEPQTYGLNSTLDVEHPCDGLFAIHVPQQNTITSLVKSLFKWFTNSVFLFESDFMYSKIQVFSSELKVFCSSPCLYILRDFLK